MPEEGSGFAPVSSATVPAVASSTPPATIVERHVVRAGRYMLENGTRGGGSGREAGYAVTDSERIPQGFWESGDEGVVL